MVESGRESVVNIRLGATSDGTGIRVTSGASGLKLWVDGKEAGDVPRVVSDLEPGEHTIRVAGNESFKPYEQKVQVEQGELIEVNVKPVVLKGIVKIKRGAEADGATVVLAIGDDRRALPELPVKISVPADGQHTVVATKEGYEEFRKPVEFEDGIAELTVVVDMVAAGDDEEEEDPAPTAGKVAAAPGPAAAAPGPPSAAKAPAPAAGGRGKVNVNSIPPSSVTVNGRSVGTTPVLGIDVKAGPVTAVFTHPELGRQARSGVVKPGATLTLAVRFKKKE